MKSRLINEHLEFLKENIQHIYNCNKKILYPPKNFITYNIITDENDKYKNEIQVDECLANEIEELWNKGIKTTGCCCGHGVAAPYIGVTEENIQRMKDLGYEVQFNSCRPEAEDSFVPKTELNYGKSKCTEV